MNKQRFVVSPVYVSKGIFTVNHNLFAECQPNRLFLCNLVTIAALRTRPSLGRSPPYAPQCLRAIPTVVIHTLASSQSLSGTGTSCNSYVRRGPCNNYLRDRVENIHSSIFTNLKTDQYTNYSILYYIVF